MTSLIASWLGCRRWSACAPGWGVFEATIFAAPGPVRREVLSKALSGWAVTSTHCCGTSRSSFKRGRMRLCRWPGDSSIRTRPEFAGAIRASNVLALLDLSFPQRELTVLMAIAYFQRLRGPTYPPSWANRSAAMSSRILQSALCCSGASQPPPGAPYSYVTTPHFLQAFGFNSLKDLPDMEKLTEAGLLDQAACGQTLIPRLRSTFRKPKSWRCQLTTWALLSSEPKGDPKA